MTTERRHSLTGWVFVGAQAILLVALVVLPDRDDWSVPWWLDALGVGLVVAGLAVLVVSARSLGSALTATPEPRAGERLRTDGLYARVRHPIYSGVLLAVLGIVVRSGSWVSVAIGVATLAFFTAKAAWEEHRLGLRYPEYREYSARTGRFLPRLRR